MSKTLQTKFDEWRTLCDHNRYTLDFVLDQGYLLGFESHNMDQSHTIIK
jgi:hypothetical protein